MDMLKDKWFIRLANRCKKNGNYKIILDRDNKEPYLERYYLHSRLCTLGLFRIVIHRFWKSDTDVALHDHPWLFWGTLILRGGYLEHTQDATQYKNKNSFGLYSGWKMHRIVLSKSNQQRENGVWTLFIMGPKIKSWGFLKNNKQWVHWKEFLANKA